MARKPLRILCFGDSLTSGYFCFGMDSHPYSLKLEDKLTGALPGVDVETVTNGVPGDVATFKRFTDRMRDECGCPFSFIPMPPFMLQELLPTTARDTPPPKHGPLVMKVIDSYRECR